MPKRDIIVIGASAGGIEALQQILGGLPADLPAAVFAVLHIRPGGNRFLPDVLNRRSALRAAFARDGQAIEHRCVYIAPPDRHMLVRDGRIELSHGPRENGFRPALDPTFRTAAMSYGERVVGVVLSGALSDGTVGLAIVKAYKGITIAQDPDEARFESMPRSAINFGEADLVRTAGEIAPLLLQLTAEEIEAEGEQKLSNIVEPAEVIRRDLAAQEQDKRDNDVTIYTCPDCGGALWQIEHGKLIQFQCHVGHRWDPQPMLEQKSEQVEAALWMVVRLLTEKATITRQLASRLQEDGDPDRAAHIAEQADVDDRHQQVLRELLEEAPNPTLQTQTVLEAYSGDGRASDG